MLKFIKTLLLGLPCDHKKNYSTARYNLDDGTPMSRFHCLDCGLTDEGPVIGEGDSPLVVVIRNGIEDYRHPPKSSG